MNWSQTSHRLLSALIRKVAIPIQYRRYQRFERLLGDARSVQRDLLFEWLGRCRNSRFGRDHGFSEIRTLEDYRRQVPVAGYDHFAPYIDAVARGDCEALFPLDQRPQRFTITTGSTGVPKLNPVTPTWLRNFRAAWDVWGIKMLADHPDQMGGKILQIVGSWNMGRTPGGIPISMVSTLMIRKPNPIVRKFFVIPHEVSDIRDAVARYYAILRLSIPHRIGLVVLMNPGGLIRLAQLGDEHRASLIRDIHDGTLSSAFDIAPDIRSIVASRIRARPERARELERIIERTGKLFPKDYWPQPIIATWVGGTAGYQSRYLADYFGASPLRDQGLVSSEGRHTIPFEDNKPQGVLSVTTGFYEFIPVEDTDAERPVALEGHELEVDRDYLIVMTTHSGYFRFRIGDTVRCRGFVGQAPILEFLQKSERCGDLEGEKVTEHQFLEAASDSARELGLQLKYVTAVPSRPANESSCYSVVAEHDDVPDRDVACRWLEGIDRRLRESNFLYSAKRREGVLGPPRLLRIASGVWAKYVQAEIDRRGTGDVHYKHPGLVQAAQWMDQFPLVDIVRLSPPS